MTKTFSTYLAKLEVAMYSVVCAQCARRDLNDVRLYLYARLSSANGYCKASKGSDAHNVARLMAGSYMRDVEAGDCWWRG